MADVPMKFSGDGDGAERTIASLEKKLEALNARIKNTGGKNAGKDLADGFELAGQRARAMISNLTGISSPLDAAIALAGKLKQALSDVAEQQKKTGGVQQDFAGAFRGLVLNLKGDQSLPNVKAIKERVMQMSKETNQSPLAVVNAFSAAASARGDASAMQASQAVVETLKVVPNVESAQVPMAAGVLDFMKFNKGVTEKEALGYALTLQSQARVQNIGPLMKNISPALGTLKEVGVGSREAGAMASALSQGMGDAEGALTKTAMQSFAIRLKEFLPDEKDFSARLAKTRANPALAKQFLDKAAFDVGSSEHIASIVTGQGTAAGLYDNALPNFKPLAVGAKELDALTDDLASDEIQQNDVLRMGLGAAAERTRLKDTRGGRKGILLNGLDLGLQAAGTGYLGRMGANMLAETWSYFGADPMQNVQETFGEGARKEEQFLQHAGGMGMLNKDQIADSKERSGGWSDLLDTLRGIETNTAAAAKRQVERNGQGE